MSIVSKHHINTSTGQELMRNVAGIAGEGPAAIRVPTAVAHSKVTPEQLYGGTAKNSVNILSSICIDKVRVRQC